MKKLCVAHWRKMTPSTFRFIPCIFFAMQYMLPLGYSSYVKMWVWFIEPKQEGACSLWHVHPNQYPQVTVEQIECTNGTGGIQSEDRNWRRTRTIWQAFSRCCGEIFPRKFPFYQSGFQNQHSSQFGKKQELPTYSYNQGVVCLNQSSETKVS